MKKEKKRCGKKATTKRIQWRIWGAYWVLMVCCSHSHWLQYHGSSDSLALSLSLRCLVWRLLFFYSLHDVIFLFFLVVVVVVGFFISFAAGFYVVRMLLWFYGKYLCVCVLFVVRNHYNAFEAASNDSRLAWIVKSWLKSKIILCYTYIKISSPNYVFFGRKLNSAPREKEKIGRVSVGGNHMRREKYDMNVGCWLLPIAPFNACMMA